VEKSVDADGAGAGAAVATRFAYDGWNPAKGDALGTSEFDVWADLDGSSSLTTRYVRGDQVDQMFARLTSSDANRWYLVDHQGSVRNILDNGAASKDALAYDAFGNIVSESNSAERGRYTWTSREIDTETDLQYNRARYYDAATGRWISQDPIGFDAGDSNLYRYSGNISVVNIDPSGLQTPAVTDESFEASSNVTKAIKEKTMTNNDKYGNMPLVGKTPDGDDFAIVITRSFAGVRDLTIGKNKLNSVYVNPVFLYTNKDYDQIRVIQLFYESAKQPNGNLLPGSRFPHIQIKAGTMPQIIDLRGGDIGWGVDGQPGASYPWADTNTFANIGTENSPAQVWDAPGELVGKTNVSWRFITCFIGCQQDGKIGKNPVYLASFRWGFDVDGNGKVAFDSAAPILDKTPGNKAPPELASAMYRWNNIAGLYHVPSIKYSYGYLDYMPFPFEKQFPGPKLGVESSK
jgi:RHS repeat-associated protein